MPTKVNLNTASAVVLWASIDKIDMSDAQRLVQSRDSQHFRSESDAARLIGSQAELTAATHSVSSSYFEVRGRLRLGTAVVETLAGAQAARPGAHPLARARQLRARQRRHAALRTWPRLRRPVPPAAPSGLSWQAPKMARETDP